LNSRPIKILLVTHYYPDHKSGVEIVAGKLAELLAQKNFEITWMALRSEFRSEQNNLSCLPARGSNIIEDRLHIPYPLWTISSVIELWRQVKRADIIHLHDYIYMSSILAFLFSKLNGKPVIITQHIGFIPYDSKLFRLLLGLMNKTIGVLMLRHSCQTIYISDVVRKYFARRKSSGNNALLIPNGVDLSSFQPCRDEQRMAERRKRNLPEDKPVFLFAGRFVEKKGLPILRELASQNQEALWIFAGWGPMDPASWQLPNVVVYRNLAAAELRPLYQLADLLVLPSKGEGFPLVVQEAMACGTPAMVGADTALAIPEVTPLLLSEDVAGESARSKWNAKIREFITNPSRLKNLRTPVAEFARRNWSWEKCAEEYQRIFEQLTASR